jgi:hypothetical protein
MKFLLGLILGALIAFPLAHNLGAGKPLFSNPLEKKDLMEKTRDLAAEIASETGKSFDESMADIKKAIHDATK